MYIDAYQLIVQKDMDGGDTLQREGMYAFGKSLLYDMKSNTVFVEQGMPPRPSPEQIMNTLEVEPGIYIRHPDPKKWYSNPLTTSRDQLIPVIAYCAAHEDYARLWRLFTATLSRGMFAQNFLRIGDGEYDLKIPDPMPLTIALFIRAGGWWTIPLYPVLIVTDGIELMNTLFTALPLHWKDDHLIPRLRSPDDVDDNNAIIQHLMAIKFKPTPVSELNRYVYSVTRAVNDGNIKLGEKNPVMGAMRWYHHNEFGAHGNPDMAELYRPLIETYFTYKNPFEFIKSLLDSNYSELSGPRIGETH
jgi:hypothetical protein